MASHLHFHFPFSLFRIWKKQKPENVFCYTENGKGKLKAKTFSAVHFLLATFIYHFAFSFGEKMEKKNEKQKTSLAFPFLFFIFLFLFPVSFYIHTYRAIYMASTVHVESEALEAVARQPTIWQSNKFSGCA